MKLCLTCQTRPALLSGRGAQLCVYCSDAASQWRRKLKVAGVVEKAKEAA
jgi:hypothetical protein